ncbi:EAL domain-containing protein [Aliikangiella sp. IMCC44359]|uniref:EAL domain-containing protein n=1 Tax=Aliikangiella sp. IMCC44359 TaxID=3459125 RepID=UPI00403B3740
MLLTLQAISLSQTQLEYKNDLMSSVSQSVLEELTQTLTTQRLKIALFNSSNKKLLDTQVNSPQKTNEESYMQVLTGLRKELPATRLYTLISPTGKNLLQHITGNFLPDCTEEVKETVKLGRQQRLFLHRSKSSTHYDLIQPRDVNIPEKGYLFVAFNIDFIDNLLQKYQLPYQQLFLLRNDKSGFIEVSSESLSGLNSTSLLDKATLSGFEHSLPIPNTRWSFVIRLDPESKSKFFKKTLWQSFVTWSIITALLLIALLQIKRNLELKYLSQLELNQSRQNAETLINSVNEAVISIDQRFNITFANSRAKSMLNMSSPQLVGKNFPDICELYNLQENEKQSFSQMIKNYQSSEIPEYSNLTLKLTDTTHIPVAVKLARIYDQDAEVRGFAITIEDLSTAIELSKRLIYHESRDSLTGLFNRRHLEKNLGKILSQTKKGKPINQPAIILVDLDKFQLLNTSHGFEAGDEFLKRLAILLRKAIPGNDFLSRLSSDEFAIIIKNANDTKLIQICESIKNAIRNFQFEWQDESLSVSVCLGVVKIDENFNDINEVLSAADHACRLAKSKGPNITQYYQTDDPEIQQQSEEATKVVDLKKALNQDNFVLFRQAIKSTREEKLAPEKYEVLIRMRDKDNHIISPIHFIPIAEKYGFMAKIDHWVIQHTLMYLAELGVKDSANYNINISSKTLSERRIIPFVNELFEEYAVSPSRINFEVTETSAISYLDNALDFMQAMKSKGCTFSLDDFGTGLASFDYLRKLPIDFLKIDGVFVKDIQTNPNDCVFIEAIHKISSQMKIQTVAEFVENENIYNILKNIGVDYVQGYYLQKPQLWYDNKHV